MSMTQGAGPGDREKEKGVARAAGPRRRKWAGARGRVWAEKEMATRAEAERGEEFWPAARTERGGFLFCFFLLLLFQIYFQIIFKSF